MRPLRVVIVDRGPHPETGAPGIAAVVSVEFESEQEAAAMTARISEVLAERAAHMPFAPSERFAGMMETPSPVGPLAFGPRRDAGGAWRFEILVGESGDPDALAAALPAAPAGFERVQARGRIDFGAMSQFTGMAAAMAQATDPTSAPLFEMLSAAGLLGPDARSFDYVMGVRAGWRVSRLRSSGGGGGAVDAAAREELTDAELAVAPADAVAVLAGKEQFAWVWHALDLLEENVPDAAMALEQFRDRTGVDPRADIRDALGATSVLYRSDSTGGGGWMSAVLAAAISDRARFVGAVDRLCAAFNGLVGEQPEAPKGLRMHRWSDGGVEYAALHFAGFPMPLEPTLALTDRWALLCATPQAAAVAVRHATGRGAAGLPSNGAFRRAMDSAPVEGVRKSVRFIDTERLARQGYGTLTLVGAMMANLSRDPEDAGGAPALVVPTYRELVDGAKATLVVSWWAGDNVVTERRSDESWAVAGAGAAGAGGGMGPYGLATMGGILLPALGRARTNAQVLKDAAQLRQIGAGAMAYATNNNDRFPASFDDMLEARNIVPEILVSPIGSPDEHGDYLLRFDAKLDFDAEAVLGYSRASYGAGRGVNVLFGDGHTRLIPTGEFLELIRQPRNRDVDWRLPGEERVRPGF